MKDSRKEGVTIHDIAKALGVNSSTVSRALNDSPKVLQKTKEKVFAKASELGYQKNSLASNLRMSKTNTIGVILPRVSRHFFASVISGIEEVAYKNGYIIVICQSLDSLEREKKLLRTLYSKRVDGILMSVSMETKDSSHINQFKNTGCPIILFDRPFNIGDNTNVIIDDFKTSYNAVVHLIKKGCKHIVHFAGPQHSLLYKRRAEGYKAALEAHGIELGDEYMFSSKLMKSDGIEGAKKILELPTVDGVFSANDIASIAAMQYLMDRGVKIPEDIAFVGFSNEPVSAVMNPALTTTNQPGVKIGETAANLLIQKIENKNLAMQVDTVILEAPLILRDSSKK